MANICSHPRWSEATPFAGSLAAIIAFDNPLEDAPAIEATVALDLLPPDRGGLRARLVLPTPSLVFRDLDVDDRILGYTVVVGAEDDPDLEPGTSRPACRATFIGVAADRVRPGRAFALWMGRDVGSAVVIAVHGVCEDQRQMTDRPRTDDLGWFEELYAKQDDPPWQRDRQRISLEQWVESQGLDGAGTKRAAVVGCGLGTDAEYIASKNYNTVGFDLSPTAIRRARELHPGTQVEYVTADLLRLPSDWHHAFDLVVEVWTVQALPDPPRTQAIEAIASLVAPGGDLIVIAIAREDDGPDFKPDDGPPWFLNRRTITNFATLTGLTANDIDNAPDPEAPDRRRSWTAHFSRAR